MDKYASEKFLSRDLQRLINRISREGITIKQKGVFVELSLLQRKTGERFNLLMICDGYPRKPMNATFLTGDNMKAVNKWPDDGEFVFRSKAPIPFICLPGLMTYSPEGLQANNPYSREDLRVGCVLGRIMDAINDDRCTGVVRREPGV